MKILKLIYATISVLAFAISMKVNATLIVSDTEFTSSGGGIFTLQNEVVTDTSQNLEWLQWSATTGLTYSSVFGSGGLANTLYGGGWTLATQSQVFTLIENFGFGTLSITNNSLITPFEAGDTDSDFLHRQFIRLFGVTISSTFVSPGTTFEETWAYYQREGLPTTLTYISVNEDASFSNGFTDSARVSYAGTSILPTSAVNPVVGFALVRETSDVPEPSLMSLFALGVVGVLIRRRRAR